MALRIARVFLLLVAAAAGLGRLSVALEGRGRARRALGVALLLAYACVCARLTLVGRRVGAGPQANLQPLWSYRCLSYVPGVVCFVGYHAVVDDVVSLCFGAGQGVGRPVVLAVALSQLAQFMRSTQLLFRNASGTFWHDRWKPVAEGVGNLALSLVLVHVLPGESRVAGVVLATVATTLLVCDTVEPWVVFRHVLGRPPLGFYVRSYAYTGAFVACLAAVRTLAVPCESPLAGIMANGLLSLVVSAAALGLLAAVDPGFRRGMRGLLRVGVLASD